jgi:uncharacterized repeat protein (TIGR03803 family)
MKGKFLFVVLFALLAGSAYGAGPQPVVVFTFVCTTSQFQGSGPCPKGGRPGPLIQGSDGNFYGTAQVSSEGASQPNGGTVFLLLPAGIFKLRHTFGPGLNNAYANGNNPGLLIEGPDGKLYGTTLFGGVNNNGVLYRVGKNGLGFQVIHQFCSKANCTDGARGLLVVGPDGNLYGSSFTGGTGNCGQYYQGCGTIFRVTPSSGAYEVVFNFDPSTTGEFPLSITLTSDGTLHGTASGPSGVELFHYTPATGVFKTTALNFPAPNGLPSAPGTSLTLGPNGNFYGLYHEYGTCCEGLFEVALDGSHLQLFPEISTLRSGSTEGLLLASDHNFWLADYNGGSGAGAIMTLSPSQGTVLQTLGSVRQRVAGTWCLSRRADPSQRRDTVGSGHTGR